MWSRRERGRCKVNDDGCNSMRARGLDVNIKLNAVPFKHASQTGEITQLSQDWKRKKDRRQNE